ncbi:GDP-mannose 4,6-dehydratase [Mycolicibacterium baixiangningiae]|uniref:GDP-mannose 4,6-dehydratase n=1 Tax=Mycolicibacterium baixiangningiae TaxID=2761578 RepID=UPI0018D17A16|nr:GDP-mannose 4,6-dehydratase [Mycolicibacterium baixiangningiae]
MRTFVTGAAGFIGSTLVDRLLADGHRVVGIDNLTTGDLANLNQALAFHAPGRFTFVQADVQSPELSDIVAGSNPDVIFHLAAQVDVRISVADPLLDARNNVLGTINVCEAARAAGVRRIVYAASGGSRYGAPLALPVDEETPAHPLSPYGVAKMVGELYLGAYAQMYDIAPICLALANVYGPRQNPHGEAGVVAMFGSAMLQGRPVNIYGDGTASRDYVYVGDVVEAFARAGESSLDITGTFNIGTGQQVTVREVHRVMAALVDGSLPPNFAAARTGELQAIALDAAAAEASLGWKPAVGFTEGIERTVSWLRATLAPDPAELIGA